MSQVYQVIHKFQPQTKGEKARNMISHLVNHASSVEEKTQLN